MAGAGRESLEGVHPPRSQALAVTTTLYVVSELDEKANVNAGDALKGGTPKRGCGSCSDEDKPVVLSCVGPLGQELFRVRH